MIKIWSSRIARHSSSCLGDNPGKATDDGVVFLAAEMATGTVDLDVAFFFTMLTVTVMENDKRL